MTPRVEGANYNAGRWKDVLEGPDNGLWRVSLHSQTQYRGTLGECIGWREARPEGPYNLIQEVS